MRRGFFLTFEGLDGSGKTTQLRRLADALERQGVPTLITRQPGDTALGERLRSLLLDSKLEADTGGIAPMAEMALMFADRAQSIREIIAPALAGSNFVLCDRFTDSTEAYQGGGRQLGSDVVLELHRVLCANLQPDLTILLLPDLDASLSRARRRNTRQQKVGSDENRFEQENRAFYERVYAKYREIAVRDSVRVITIEGDHPIEATHQHILQSVQERWNIFQLAR